LVTDFDGTMTRRDFYDLVRERWPVPPDDDPWDHYVSGRITHFEALAAIFARIRSPESALRELAVRMDLDPELPQAVRALQAAGWRVIVASAGCAWYIEQHLAGLPLEVRANPGVYAETGGLRMTLPETSPYFSRQTGIDKVAITQAALDTGAEVAFAGDGRPDLAPALLVPPARRFARGWLADTLRERGETFQPFTRWSQIARALLAKEIAC